MNYYVAFGSPKPAGVAAVKFSRDGQRFACNELVLSLSLVHTQL
jgi:hypothetical protein